MSLSRFLNSVAYLLAPNSPDGPEFTSADGIPDREKWGMTTDAQAGIAAFMGTPQ